MNISKISRSIVVGLFIIMIIFFSVINIKVINSGVEVTNSVTSNIAKLCYVIILITLVLIYMYIKEKLYRLKVKKKVALIYRYIYIVFVLIATSITVAYSDIKILSRSMLCVYILISVLTGLVVKRIIFNVSKSDMLSVFGMFANTMLINVIHDKTIMLHPMLLELFTLLTIYIFQKLIDELKQRGIKNNKYLNLSIVLGLSVAFSILFGVNQYVWIVLGIVLFFLTSNLDRTSFVLSQKTMDKHKKEGILKVDKINISKLLISLIVILITSFVTYQIMIRIVNILPSSSIVESITYFRVVQNYQLEFASLKMYTENFVSFSKTYYMILFIYILLLEILAICLHRRYDTKSTVIKFIFMGIFLLMVMTNKNIYYYQPLFSTMLMLIAIVNTTNIYYNREERIKLLVAQGR